MSYKELMHKTAGNMSEEKFLKICDAYSFATYGVTSIDLSEDHLIEYYRNDKKWSPYEAVEWLATKWGLQPVELIW